MNTSERSTPGTSSIDTLTPYKWLLWLMGGFAGLACSAALSLFVIRSQQLDWLFSTRPSDFIDFGIFIGSVFTPLIATASLLLFWKTLRVQMKELKISSESLQSTADTTARLLDQERRLFELKQLSTVITESKSIMANIGNELIVIKRTIPKPNDPYADDAVNIPLKDLIIEKDRNSLAGALSFDKGKLDETLDSLIMLSSYLVKYASYGGDLTHYRPSCKELLKLTEPFFQSEKVFLTVFESDSLADKARILSKLYKALKDYKQETELVLSNLLSNEQKIRDRSPYSSSSTKSRSTSS